MDNIYNSIAERTSGNIYLGVVGPVRTGKSTFITRFMEKMVLPSITSGVELERVKDELPQSGSGNLIMTMQPKFVPSQAVELNIGKINAKVRLVDSVGYLIDGVSGHIAEDGSPRMVNTPWQKEALPFVKAAEVGTSKVITDHSTIGVIITTDGSIAGIERSAYTEAEERTIKELKNLNKPFVVVLNTLFPNSEETLALKKAMEEKYGAKVSIQNVKEMEEPDFESLFEMVLYEFPLTKIELKLPEWASSLNYDSEIISGIIEELKKVNYKKVADYPAFTNLKWQNDDILSPKLANINLATGTITLEIGMKESLYYKTLSDFTGEQVLNSSDLMGYILNASKAKREYDKIKEAFIKAADSGYGVVMPAAEDMNLSKPEVVNKNNSSTLKLKAKAPSYHILKVDVEMEVSPAVSGSVDFVEDKNEQAENGEEAIWQTSMFGKTLTQIAHEGLITKLNTFPKEAEGKLVKTVTKITNEGKGGIICILL